MHAFYMTTHFHSVLYFGEQKFFGASNALLTTTGMVFIFSGNRLGRLSAGTKLYDGFFPQYHMAFMKISARLFSRSFITMAQLKSPSP